MNLEELAGSRLDGNRGSAHHDSLQSLRLHRGDSQQVINVEKGPTIEIDLVAEQKTDLALFFEHEYKSTQRELVQTKSHLYEQTYKVDLLKRRLMEAEHAAESAQSEM